MKAKQGPVHRQKMTTNIPSMTAASAPKYKIKICKKEKTTVVSVPVVMPSKNSEVAKKGFKAEELLCESETVKKAWEVYFGKKIATVTQVPKRKKSDLQVTFEDGSVERIQTKDGNGNNRGWSCDRRSVDKYPLEEEGKQLLSNICLKKGVDRPEVKCPDTIIDNLFLGTEADTAPTYFCHTQIDNKGQLLTLSICPTSTFVAELKKELYPFLLPKRTCVHLSPRIYLQRKGGGQKDHAPNDIQLKIKSLPIAMYTQLYSSTSTASPAPIVLSITNSKKNASKKEEGSLSSFFGVVVFFFRFAVLQMFL